MSTSVVLILCATALLVACCGIGAVMEIVSPDEPRPAAEPARTATTANTPASVHPTMATVPNLVGKNAAVATDELERLGFVNIDYGSVDIGETVLLPVNWTVAEQSHAPGVTIPTDTLIVLGCTKQR